MKVFKSILIIVVASILTVFFWCIDESVGIVFTWFLAVMLPICKWANTPTDKFKPEKSDPKEIDESYF